MLERVIENWLDDATERTFQVPFCYMLARKGHTVVHLSRHTPMELGKDVLSVAPDGTPCAFQLKTAPKGKIGLKQWREELQNQCLQMMTTAPVHPSLSKGKTHRSYFVCNGELEEEVIRAIEDMNLQFVNSGQAHISLRTIVRGQLLRCALDIQEDLWPSELHDIRTLLELYLEDGRGFLPVSKLTRLLETMLGLGEELRPQGQAESSRAVASAALLCGIATSSFRNAENHLAEIQAWITYLASLFGAVEAYSLPKSVWATEATIAVEVIFQSLESLYEVAVSRPSWSEGDLLVDAWALKARTTYLVGALGIYGLWKRRIGDDQFGVRKTIKGLLDKHLLDSWLWGESAIPYFLGAYWYWRLTDGTARPDVFLVQVLAAVVKLAVESETGLPAPYDSAEDVMMRMMSPGEEAVRRIQRRVSYTAEGLLQLVARRNWKEPCRTIWPSFSRLELVEFKPTNLWQVTRWRNENGVFSSRTQDLRKEWKELRQESSNVLDPLLPKAMQKYPLLVLLFVMTYPHRLTSATMRWLDHNLRTEYDFEI